MEPLCKALTLTLNKLFWAKRDIYIVFICMTTQNKKRIWGIIIIIILWLLTFMNCSCTYYVSPDRAANPRHTFERSSKRYERKMRRYERRNIKTIDPLRWHH